MPLALLLAAATAFAAPAPDDQAVVLAELRERGVVPAAATAFTDADLKSLDRIQRDEPAALELLGKRFGDERALMSRGYLRGPALHRRLTKDGDERYRALLSQDAVHFFEGKGVPIRDMFAVKDAEDRPLFDADGRLTAEGFAVYTRAAAGLDARWKGADGKAFGAPPAAAAAAEAAGPWRRLYLLADSRGQGVWWPHYEGRPSTFYHGLEGESASVDYPGIVAGQPYSAEDCFVTTAIALRGTPGPLQEMRVLGFADRGCTGRLETLRWWKMTPEDAAVARRMTQAQFDALAAPLEAYFRSINVLR